MLRAACASAALACGLCALLALAAGLALLRARSFDLVTWLEAAEPWRVNELESHTLGSSLERRDLVLADAAGEVRASLRLPLARADRLPAVIILGGIETGHHAVDLVPDTAPFVVAALDYAYDGPSRTGIAGFLWRLPRTWHDLRRTTAACRDLGRYVGRLPQVDARRVYLLGASLGTPFAAAAAAGANRPAGLVLLYGFADHTALLERLLEPHVHHAWLRRRLARWGGVLTQPFDATRTLPRACGVPVLVIGSSADQEVPQRCAEALWNAACEPRTRIDLPGGHIRPRPDERLRQVTDEILRWLQRQAPDS